MARRTNPDLPARLEALRSALQLAEGRLDPEALTGAHFILDKADARLVHGTEHTVAALAGATGSGKSSVFNALSGSAVSNTGVRRPTTGEAHASIFGGDDAAPLLDWMRIKHRHQVPSPGETLTGLVLIDLPDHDSVELENRLEMERVAELVDLLIWVTDPEKYADAALHHYLRKLAGHDETTMVALNKIDRLTPEAVSACQADLARLLRDDGLTGVTVVAVSATTGSGVPDLVTILGSTVSGRKAAVARLTNETVDVAGELRKLTGERSPGKLSGAPRQRLVDSLADATGIPAVTAAVEAGYKVDAQGAAGWPYTRWMRRFRPHPLRRLHLGPGTLGRVSLPEAGGVQQAAVTQALRNAADQVSDQLAEPWPTLARSAVTRHQAELADELDQAVRAAEPGSWSTPLWWRAMGALQLVFALSLAAGLIWLAVLAGFSYLRVPEPPTPEFRDFPIPTLLCLGGLVAGLVITVLVKVVASVAAKRRGRVARKRMMTGIEDVAETRVIDPLQTELAVVSDLRSHLDVAAAPVGRRR